MNLYQIRNVLAQGKKLIDLPLRVTFYARVSTDHEEQLNSLENQLNYYENYIKEENLKIENKYHVNLLANYYLLISFYNKIEKRGFRVENSVTNARVSKNLTFICEL